MGDLLLCNSLQMMGMMMLMIVENAHLSISDVSSEPLQMKNCFSIRVFVALISSSRLMFRFCFPLGFLYFLFIYFFFLVHAF